MKSIYKNVLVFALLGCLSFFGGCKKHSIDPIDANKNIIVSHPWKLQNLTVDGVDKTSLYPGMTLTFTTTNYTASKGIPVWPDNGTWSFATGSSTTIVRDDGVEVSIDQINDSSLDLSLTWTKTTLAGGRQGSVSGKHVFTFVK